MSKGLKNYLSNIPPHVAILGVLLAVVAGAGVAFLLSRSEPTANASFVPRAARIERVEGSVDIARTLAEQNVSEPAWEEAVRNAPLAVGDRVYAREGSRATVALTGRNYARLDSGSALDVLSLADRRTQLALRDGSALFDVGEITDGELFEVATPSGAVDFYEPGLYQVGIGDDGNSWVSVLSGLAQVVGLAGSGQVSKGEILTLVGQTAAQALLSRMAPDYAGGIVDDYYGYRYPNSYDGRYRNYDAYLDDPYYYDPYRQSVSYRYVDDDIPGVYDLDYYGDWSDIDGYGHCWAPRVESSWVPYRNGYWDVENVYGPTWISSEPWGWAPYHYGRWAYINNRQWVWVPDSARTHSVYAPALVAFVPITRTNQIGWVPLAPGEAYVSRYYDAGYQPQYFASPDVLKQVVTVQHTYINSGYPQAVTVVPVQDFTRAINPRMISDVNPQWIAESQPVLDPYAIDSLRRQAISKKEEKRRLKAERALNNQAFNTAVVTSAAPVMMPGRTDVGNALQVATVPEKQKKQKIKFNDSGQVVSVRNKDGAPRPPIPQPNASDVAQERGQRIAALKTQAAQGDKAARQEIKQLKREQRLKERGIAVNPAPATTNAQPDVARNERKAQKRLERRQRAVTGQQNQPRFNQQQPSANVEKQQRKAQKRLERQQQGAATGQRPQINQQTYADQQVRDQRKAQKRAAREQRMTVQRSQPSFNQQAAYNAELEQRRAQKRAMREQRMNHQSAYQQQVMVEQQKQRVFVQQADKQQRKAERRAARVQQVQPQAPSQIRVQPRVEDKGPPANPGSMDAQRRAVKAERKAARKNQ
jgi:hypothetical protein